MREHRPPLLLLALSPGSRRWPWPPWRAGTDPSWPPVHASVDGSTGAPRPPVLPPCPRPRPPVPPSSRPPPGPPRPTLDDTPDGAQTGTEQTLEGNDSLSTALLLLLFLLGVRRYSSTRSHVHVHISQISVVDPGPLSRSCLHCGRCKSVFS